MCHFFCCCCPCESCKSTVEPIPEPIILKPDKRENDEIKQWILNIKLLSENMKLHNYISTSKSLFKDFKDEKSMKNLIEKAPCETLLERIFTVFLLTKTTSLNSQETAKIFVKLCSFIKVESIVIHGYAKNNPINLSEKNHFWNAFKFNNLFYYVDVTWARDKSSNYYFMTPPQIFVESHFSPDFVLHKPITFHEFESIHANELEFYIIGLKQVQPIRGSVINCYSNPFYFEYTCDDSIELTAKLSINENQVENGVIIQTDMSSKPFKYCVFFFLNDKDKLYTLDLFGKNQDFKAQKLLSKYSLKKIADVFPNDLPKYNLINDSIKCLSHDCLLVKSNDNMTNFEFSMALDTKIFGVLKNLDEKQQVDLPVIAQYVKKDSKFMVLACTPVNVERAIVEFYKSVNDRDYDVFMKMCLVKQNRQSVVSKLVKVDSDQNGFFINSPLDFHLIMNKEHKFRYHVDNAKWLKILNSEGRETPFSRSNNNLYELEYTPTKTGPLKVLVKRENGCFILTTYEVVEKRKHIVIDSPIFLSTIS